MSVLVHDVVRLVVTSSVGSCARLTQNTFDHSKDSCSTSQGIVWGPQLDMSGSGEVVQTTTLNFKEPPRPQPVEKEIADESLHRTQESKV